MNNKHWESVLIISGSGIFEVLGEFGEISCCGFLGYFGIEECVEEILLGLLALWDGVGFTSFGICWNSKNWVVCEKAVIDWLEGWMLEIGIRCEFIVFFFLVGRLVIC